MIRFKINVLEVLKENGFTTYKLLKDGYFGSATIHDFKHGKVVYGKSLDKLCSLLNCQPGDLLEYIPDEANSEIHE